MPQQKTSNIRKWLPRLALMIALIVIMSVGGYAIVLSQNAAGTTSAASTDETVQIAETGTVEVGTLTLTLDAAGSLTPADSRTLMFSVSAPVTEVLVQVGDTVQAGDILARLDTTDADQRIRVAELQLEQAQASLDSLLAPPTDLEIALAEAQVTLAQAQLYAASSNSSTDAIDIEIARLEEEIARNQLWQTQINRDQRVQMEEMRGDVTWVEQQEFDASVNNAEDSVTLAQMEYQDALNGGSTSYSSVASANASLVEAQANLESLLAGPTESQRRQAEIQVEQARLNLESARESLDNYVLTAPFDGIVAEQNLIVGVNPPATGAITLVDTSQYTIDLSIAESDVINVSEGQPVTINIQAFPDAEVTGVITTIDTVPTQDSQLVSYNAQVALNPAEVLLRPGMSATATIVLRQLDNVLLVPNRFISSDSVTGETVVTVETTPGTYETVPVTIGERSTTSSQILSGVEAGQTIVIIARELDAAATDTGRLGLGLFGGGGGPPEGFQPPANFQPPAGGGGFIGGGG